MTVTSETRRRPAGSAHREQSTARRVRRTPELWIASIGSVLSFVALGGFSLVMTKIDPAAFERVVMPALIGPEAGMSRQEAFEVGRTLGAWFGATLLLVLALVSVGIFFARRRPSRRSTGWWFLAAGLACLLGSQLILYPIAFLFFVSAGLFALRPVTDGSPS
ncbi:DUF4064 domain-containing protein [Brachybacterium sp. FME24]|uniref:DUF4064 domain-containing protein n=1 Tax=Brachybacterium sp. FME24 TaxID=2742605 RepID=UPI001865F9B8|nr:DUF4064 domain-containing protein [Brachybacterium sp. FME24]